MPQADTTTSPDALAERFGEVRDRTERLASRLSAEDQMIQSMPDASPTKWHRAHTTWFFAEFVLGARGDGAAHWDRPEYRFLFNSYYDAVGARHPRPDRGMISRPSVDEIADYRNHVDEAVRSLLVAGADDETRKMIRLGTHHEEQHQELLLMDVKHALSANPAVSPAYVERRIGAAADPGPLEWVDVAGGVVEIGRDADRDAFAWDNESRRHEVRLDDFALSDRLVTAGEWLEFVADGGYERPESWKSAGWATVVDEGWTAPEYRRRDPDDPERWLQFTLSGLRPVDVDEPVVHVSHFEADAYATWRDARLPTEFEWEHAARTVDAPALDGTLPGNWLDADDDEVAYHPRAAGTPGGGLRQMFGDWWEWTSSAYQPYPGFRIAEGAIGEYNGKFMSGQQILRGGSVLTPPGHARVTYRNFFHPHQRWMASGVRLATDRAA